MCKHIFEWVGFTNMLSGNSYSFPLLLILVHFLNLSFLLPNYGWQLYQWLSDNLRRLFLLLVIKSRFRHHKTSKCYQNEMFFPFLYQAWFWVGNLWKRNRKWSVLPLFSAPLSLVFGRWCFGSYMLKARKLKEEEVRLTDKNWNQVLESCGHDALQFCILWWGSCHFHLASFVLSSSWFPEVSFYFRGILIPRCYSKEETISGDKPFAVMATSAFLEASAAFRILVPFSTQALLSAASKSGSLATPSYHETSQTNGRCQILCLSISRESISSIQFFWKPHLLDLKWQKKKKTSIIFCERAVKHPQSNLFTLCQCTSKTCLCC